MTTSNTELTSHDNLEEFRHLVASAWDEGEISDLALATVCLEIIRDPHLDLSCRETLQQWLDSSEGQTVMRPRRAENRFAAAG